MSSPTRTPPRVRTIVWLFIFITAANVFDLWATSTLIRDGRAEEANPIVRDMLAFGPDIVYPWKIALLAFATVPLAFLSRKRRLAWIVFCATAIGFAALTATHVYLLSLPFK